MKFLIALSFFLSATQAAPLTIGAGLGIGTKGVTNNNNNNKCGQEPATEPAANNNICTGLYRAPQCCAASVQGIANVDCVRRTPAPNPFDLNPFANARNSECRID